MKFLYSLILSFMSFFGSLYLGFGAHPAFPDILWVELLADVCVFI